MALSPSQIRYLRSLAHDLSPVVLLGNKGASEAVVKELGLALEIHELVKVKLSGGDKEDRQAQIDTLTRGTGAEQIHQIGHVVVLFRRNTDEPKIALPR
ncbi:RNA-binding protein [Rhodanobacter thiooxydans]|uniref:RNA-binding protein n=1 Tax=Rhodanobacter thiooxydans TaxID=416169 RepID=A0A154QFB4_9GAMM|nr:ribosome assembly RNA-binding protein YhbY [Rhodanobacter thiooxydans]EIM01379.1 putative RNA-binding protein containing KH domain, possibly ribosomal protein [Rhodanobacter thiooxydans LCS2]KZC22938.1 RNA-binding protein [Rhodanobacter thiooxydans]MCW0202217.1 ribosome assembly RNA-binding protein YhbY [Rhodanobacter thiooxydans]